MWTAIHRQLRKRKKEEARSARGTNRWTPNFPPEINKRFSPSFIFNKMQTVLCEIFIAYASVFRRLLPHVRTGRALKLTCCHSSLQKGWWTVLQSFSISHFYKGSTWKSKWYRDFLTKWNHNESNQPKTTPLNDWKKALTDVLINLGLFGGEDSCREL